MLLLQAAAGQSGAQPAATKAKGRGRQSKAAAQAAAAAGTGAAAAAAAVQEDANKLKLAGLLAVMGKLASAEPLVSLSLVCCPPSCWSVLCGYTCWWICGAFDS